MCFDLDSRPPIAPIAGGALDSERLVLTAEDGEPPARLPGACRRANRRRDRVLPDVRGLHPFYEELALRFAENGIDALAIDYFGRTAGAEPRATTASSTCPTSSRPHGRAHRRTSRAAAERSGPTVIGRSRALFTIGFCFGGRLAFLTAAMGLDLAGAIGFYGRPTPRDASDTMAPIERVGSMQGSILGLFGGADAGIPAESISAFDGALGAAGLDHRLVTYTGAPHSFFDRKASEFAVASAAAWSEVLEFIRTRTT